MCMRERESECMGFSKEKRNRVCEAERVQMNE